MTISPNWKIDPTTGTLTSPTSKEIDIAAMPTIAADSVLANATASAARPGALAVAAQTVLGRAAGRLAALAVATNQILGRAGGDLGGLSVSSQSVLGRAAGDIASLAVGVQSVMGRAAGNLGAISLGTDTVLGRQGSGDLAGVKVTPAMQSTVIGIGILTVDTATAIGATIPIASVTNHGSGGNVTLASNALTVPAAGIYQLDFSGGCRSSDVANPTVIEIDLMVGGVSQGRIAVQTRFSATTTNPVGVSGSTVLNITTPASQAVSLVPRLANIDRFFPSTINQLILRRIA